MAAVCGKDLAIVIEYPAGACIVLKFRDRAELRSAIVAEQNAFLEGPYRDQAHLRVDRRSMKSEKSLNSISSQLIVPGTAYIDRVLQN